MKKFVSLLMVGLVLLTTMHVLSTLNPTASASSTDWWPTFRHDQAHTGYTTSTGPAAGNLIWSYATTGGIFSSPAIVNGELYIGSRDRHLYCCNASNGEAIWNYTAGLDVNEPTVDSGFVYVTAYDKEVLCLNAATGALQWKYTTNGMLSCAINVVNGRVYVPVGQIKSPELYCLNASTGQYLWGYSGTAEVCHPAIANGMVYFGSLDNNTYCLDAITGAFKWKYTAGNWIEGSPAIVNGKVYVGSVDGSFYCLNASSGALIWKSFLCKYGIWSSPAVFNNKIYIGSYDGNLSCLDASSGAVLWKYQAGGNEISSPAIAGSNVYFGGLDHKVYCLDASSGALIWNYTTGGQIDSSPAIVEGKLYIGSEDNNVYCLGEVKYDVTISSYCNTKFVDVSVPIVMDGSTSGQNTSYTFTGLIGTHNFTVPNSDPNGHLFSNWNTAQTSTTIIVSSGGTYVAYYGVPPPETYNATIKAYCKTEGGDVSVAVIQDGTPSGHNTPFTFSGLTGSHTFTVPNADQQGHPFIQWITGQTSTTLSISFGGVFTAIYGASGYDATVFARDNMAKADVAVSITMDGTPSGQFTPHTFNNLLGAHTFTVPNSDSNGRPFVQWNTGLTFTTITVTSGGAFTAFYGSAPSPAYYVSISAFDDTLGTNVGVMITEDGSSSGFNTPHTFSGLTGSHTFAVPSGDAFAHPFKNWNTGSTSATITVSSTGSYVAHFGIQLPPPIIITKISVTPSVKVSINSVVFYSGQVTDQNGNGVPNVMVGVDDPFIQATAERSTDTSGSFTYTDVAIKNGAFLVSFYTGSVRSSTIVEVGLSCTFSAFSRISIKNPYDNPITAILTVRNQEKYRINVPMDETITVMNFQHYSPSIISGAVEACPVQWGLGSYCVDSEGTVTATVGAVYEVGAYKSAATGDWGVCGGVGGGLPYIVYGDGLFCIGTDGVSLVGSGGVVAVGGTMELRIVSFQSSEAGIINLHSPVDVLVTDPEGRRVGFDAGIGLVDEIGMASFSGPSTEPQSVCLPSLESGEYLIRLFGLDNGNYSLDLEGILADGITDSSQWINGTIVKGQIVFVLVQIAQAFCDIEVTPLKSVVGQGLCAGGNFTIANIGPSPEDFNITLCANFTCIGSEQITALQNGTYTTFSFLWNTIGFAYGNYYISATLTGTNITLTCSSTFLAGIGDLTGGTTNGLDFVPDGRVNIKDIAIVARYFGQPVPLAPTNCDITGSTPGVPDGVVNIRDISIVARQFGQTYSYP